MYLIYLASYMYIRDIYHPLHVELCMIYLLICSGAEGYSKVTYCLANGLDRRFSYTLVLLLMKKIVSWSVRNFLV